MNEHMSKYAEMFRLARRSLGYWVELSILEFTQSLRKAMGSVNQAELARKMGKSQAYVSKLLKGRDNLTIRQMNKIAGYVDAAVHIHVAKKGKVVMWQEISVDSYPTADATMFVNIEAADVYDLHNTVPEIPEVIVLTVPDVYFGNSYPVN